MAPKPVPQAKPTMKHSASESDFSATEASQPNTYRLKKSALIGLINWSHVAYTYAPHAFIVSLAIAVVSLLHSILLSQSDQSDLLTAEFVKVVNDAIESPVIFTTFVKTCCIVSFAIYYLARMDNPIYMIDFTTFEPPCSWKRSKAEIMEMMKRQGVFTEDSLDFMKRILDRSGTGEATAWPPGIVQTLEEADKKMNVSVQASRDEAEFVISEIVERALQKAGVQAKDIDILVINCSLFSPTPSLCAMVVSKFGMRQDIASYNLSGMGCSASLISIDLAKKLLLTSGKGSLALVVSTEVITPNLYVGNERRYLLQNTLFRCGGAAIVLSNRYLDGRRSQFKLLNTVRVQGNTSIDYKCVFEEEDANGNRGVTLSKDIVKVAGKCMVRNRIKSNVS
jgi:predicted naringenin-chalcone synthase